uniref:Uncharacterized protein n=1 Tax=Pseudictyota dubia TaxID=2749911 RepID=A0A7R9WCX6_9STRA
MANFRPRQSGSRHCRHSLDILSDGSDNTGHGAAFLTVFRSISGAKIDCGVLGDSHCDTASSTQLNILGRYALSGLPSPLARLASDQVMHCCNIPLKVVH